MFKLIELEWRKLERRKVIGEAVIYWVILMVMPFFFLRVVFKDDSVNAFGDSYNAAMGLMLPIQLGCLLFGASLINHVFIEPYKNKTMALSFGYPLSRQRLVMAKVLFIALATMICALVSFVLAGSATYVLDLMFDIIDGVPSMTDFAAYAGRMVIHSIVITLASLIPLFWFGIWRRAVIPTVICAIVLMQSPTVLSMLGISLNMDYLYAIVSLLGIGSVLLSVKLIYKFGDL
ncbi:hypothetical protein PCCS19_22210 [Paenibacillus sp. CCS19]|uniref:ABC transporter permease n=1 Tax=Paenibacillus sp. CCS19 TaxID=3158387 RepID=UPI00255F84A8|nr:ABC transporter permease [Paenibacillus cellulosilyticus]GMK39167.1 hypothetical protein PCCS19_22210 [Paenibacillus cellulosilyticus]